MSDYDYRNRRRGQRDDEGLILEDFCGSVELWRTEDERRFSVYMYLVADQDFKIAAEKSFNVKRLGPTARAEIQELFEAACGIVSYLPETHVLRHFLCPPRPLS